MSERRQLFGKTLFVDFLLSNLVMVMGIVALTDASHKIKQDEERRLAALRTEGVYAVIMEWPSDSADDIDLYVRDPTGKIAFFSSRDVGLMHLDHDDQGKTSDQALTQNGQVSVDRNEERVVIRGAINGEYIVNVHMYHKRDPKPTPVTIRLYRLKGEDAEVKKIERVLPRNGDEATAFRFTLKADGTLVEINELQRKLMGGTQ